MRIRCEASLDVAKNLGPGDQQNISVLNDALVSVQLADTLWAFQENHPDLNKKPEYWFRIAKLVGEHSREAIQHKKIAIQTEILRRSLGSNQNA